MSCFLQRSFCPSAIDFRKGFEVVLDGQHLGLESTYRVGAGGILIVELLSGDPPHRRINRQTMGIVDIFIASQSAVYRLTQQGREVVLDVAPCPRIVKHGGNTIE